jgi:mannose-6-phosphate isomerase-like protein (cupin superfamily)
MSDKPNIPLPTNLVLRTSGSTQRVEILGVTIDILVSGDDTAGVWSLVRYTAPPHYPAPGPHWHGNMTETFYVCAGRFRFQVGSESKDLGAGELVMVPPKMTHTLANPFDDVAQTLILFSPAGFEHYYVELATLVAQEPMWPPPSMAEVAALAAKYDTHTSQ